MLIIQRIKPRRGRCPSRWSPAELPLVLKSEGSISQPLDGETFAAIENAYNMHGVIFFRDQSLRPAQQVASTRRFGERVQCLERWSVPGNPEIGNSGRAPGSTSRSSVRRSTWRRVSKGSPNIWESGTAVARVRRPHRKQFGSRTRRRISGARLRRPNRAVCLLRLNGPISRRQRSLHLKPKPAVQIARPRAASPSLLPPLDCAAKRSSRAG